MSDLGYLVWLIASAVVIVVVLTVGTLAAAGFFTKDDAPEGAEAAAPSTGAPRAAGPHQSGRRRGKSPTRA